MTTSESIKSIAAALVAFHKEVQKIKKDGTNPHLEKKLPLVLAEPYLLI